MHAIYIAYIYERHIHAPDTAIKSKGLLLDSFR